MNQVLQQPIKHQEAMTPDAAKKTTATNFKPIVNQVVENLNAMLAVGHRTMFLDPLPAHVARATKIRYEKKGWTVNLENTEGAKWKFTFSSEELRDDLLTEEIELAFTMPTDGGLMQPRKRN